MAGEPADAIRRGREAISELAADAEPRRRPGTSGAAAGLLPQVACRRLRPPGQFDGPEAVRAAGFGSTSTALKLIAAERRGGRELAAT